MSDQKQTSTRWADVVRGVAIGTIGSLLAVLVVVPTVGGVARGAAIFGSIDVGAVAVEPADRVAAAVVLNVTATQAPAGFVTAWANGVALPNASTLNPQGVSDTRANAAILPVGNSGQIDYFVLSGAHLLADTTGYYLS